jgi:hypothetical protein
MVVTVALFSNGHHYLRAASAHIDLICHEHLNNRCVLIVSCKAQRFAAHFCEISEIEIRSLEHCCDINIHVT